jgi:hypothetical protein
MCLLQEIELAVQDFEAALRLKPDYQEARGLLSNLVEYGRDMAKTFVLSRPNPTYKQGERVKDHMSTVGSKFGTTAALSADSTSSLTTELLTSYRSNMTHSHKDMETLSSLPIIPTYLAGKVGVSFEGPTKELEGILTIFSIAKKQQEDSSLKSYAEYAKRMAALELKSRSTILVLSRNSSARTDASKLRERQATL